MGESLVYAVFFWRFRVVLNRIDEGINLKNIALVDFDGVIDFVCLLSECPCEYKLHLTDFNRSVDKSNERVNVNIYTMTNY